MPHKDGRDLFLFTSDDCRFWVLERLLVDFSWICGFMHPPLKSVVCVQPFAFVPSSLHIVLGERLPETDRK